MRKSDMVRQGAEQLFAAEDAIEKALMEVAALGQLLGKSRMDGNISAVVGQDAFDAIAATYLELSQARSKAVQLHHALKEVQIQIGCGTVMAGTGTKPKPTGGQLSIVESDAA